MTTVRLAGYISVPQVESVLARALGDFVSDDAHPYWSPREGRLDQLTLDLSDLRAIDLPTLAELVIVLRAATADTSAIEVVLPTHQNVVHFLAATRFFETLSHAPTGDRTLLYNGPVPKIASYERFFPLQWIDRAAPVEAWLTATLRRPVDNDVRMPWTVATQLARLIHRELLENVERHSGRTHALVGLVVDSRRRNIQEREFMVTEHNAWAQWDHHDIAALRVIVADEGIGVHRALGGAKHYPSYRNHINPSEPELLAWAFDRWSSSIDTSTERGTRGLYRVAKIASLYQGFATLRSGDAVATDWAGSVSRVPELPPSAWCQFNFPGTLLRVEVPISEPLPAMHFETGVAEDVHVKQLRLRPGRDEGRDGEGLSRARREAVRSAVVDSGINVLDASTLNLTTGEAREFIEECATLGHPHMTAIINLPLNDVDLHEACIDLNSIYDRKVDEGLIAADSMSPVLVIGTRFSDSHWAGCRSAVADSVRSGRVLDDQALPYIDPALRRYDSDGEVRLRLTPASLEVSTRRLIGQLTRQHTENAPDRSFIVTPSLTTANAWVKAKSIFTNPFAAELLPRLLLSGLEGAQPQVANLRPVILYEDGVDDLFARRFAQLLYREEQPPLDCVQKVSRADLECERPLNMKSGTHALVLVLAVSEGHAARQLIAYAVRQGLLVDAVLCPVDTTGSTAYVRLWGKAYPVIAAHSIACGPVRPALNDRPKFIETTQTHGVSQRLSMFNSKTLRRLLLQADAVRLGHYIGDQSRHFTYIVDPDLLLRSDVMGEFVRAAASLTGTPTPDQGLLVVVSDDHWPGDPSAQFAKMLVDHVKAPFGPKRITTLTANAARRATAESPAFLIVWNCITGRSLWAALEELCRKGARAVHVIAVFSQVEEEELRNIISVRAIESDLEQRASVQVTVLARLPFGVYNPRECPMCSRDYRAYAASSDDPGATTELQRIRSFLAVRPWTMRDVEPPRAVESREGLTRLVNLSASRRRELLGAQNSTQAAWAVRQEWAEGLMDAEFASSVAMLLIYEPFWVRRTPLSNGRMRRELGAALVRQVTEGPANLAHLQPAYLLDAIRIVSKTAFLEAAMEIFRGYPPDSDAFSSAMMRLETLLELPYIRQSSLAGEVADVADRAWHLTDDAARKRQLAELRDRAGQVPVDRADQYIAVTSLLGELRKSLADFHDHPVQDILWPRAGSITCRESAMSRAHSWRRVRTWVRDHLRPALRPVRPWLLLTNVLQAEPEFGHRVFDASGSFVFIEDLITQLETPREITAETAERLSSREADAYELVVKFLGSKYEASPSGGPFLQRAIDECSMTAFRLSEGFRMYADRKQVRGALDVGRHERSELPIPTYLARRLLNTVLANALDHGSSPAHVDGVLEPDEQAESWQLTFLSEGSGSGRARARLGVGGLEEVRLLCRQLGWVLHHGPDGDRYKVTVEAKGYVHGLD